MNEILKNLPLAPADLKDEVVFCKLFSGHVFYLKKGLGIIPERDLKLKLETFAEENMQSQGNIVDA